MTCEAAGSFCFATRISPLPSSISQPDLMGVAGILLAAPSKPLRQHSLAESFTGELR